MPVNLSLSDNSTAQHPGSKHRATHAAEDPREGDGNSGGAVALVKTEGQKSKTMSCSGGSYIEEPSADQIKAAYEQSCYNRSLVGYLKTEQRRTPDGVHEDAAEGEVREVALGGGGFPLWKQQCNIVFFFPQMYRPRTSPSSGAEAFHCSLPAYVHTKSTSTLFLCLHSEERCSCLVFIGYLLQDRQRGLNFKTIFNCHLIIFHR